MYVQQVFDTSQYKTVTGKIFMLPLIIQGTGCNLVPVIKHLKCIYIYIAQLNLDHFLSIVDF